MLLRTGLPIVVSTLCMKASEIAGRTLQQGASGLDAVEAELKLWRTIWTYTVWATVAILMWGGSTA